MQLDHALPATAVCTLLVLLQPACWCIAIRTTVNAQPLPLYHTFLFLFLVTCFSCSRSLLRRYNKRLSTQLIAPQYKFTQEHYILEGAKQVLAAGGDSYKFRLKNEDANGQPIQVGDCATHPTTVAGDCSVLSLALWIIFCVLLLDMVVCVLLLDMVVARQHTVISACSVYSFTSDALVYVQRPVVILSPAATSASLPWSG